MAASTGLLSKLARRAPAARASGSGGSEIDGDHAIAFCRTYEGLGQGSFWAADAEGRLTYLSAHAAARLLPDGGDCLGRPIADLFLSADAEGNASRSLRLALSRRSRFDRMVLRGNTGDTATWWAISGEAQFDASGTFTGFRGLCADITQDRRVADENSQMAMSDPLTGLLNRRRITALLERTIAAYKLQDRPCATMLIDLDRFKQVNDTLGHSTGDALLRQVGERLVRIVGDKEKVGRIGGDEFQVILPDKEDRGELGELAERIIAMISQPYTIEGSRCLIGASVGIAVSPFDGADVEQLVRNADLALYAAKHGGRGGFRFFSRELLQAAEQRKTLEEDLHDALERGQFALHYQPMVEARTNTVSGAEALLRWNHPTIGLVAPASFIGIAEESKLICRIGEWVLRKACADAAAWPGPLRIAVNVSPVQFIEPGFPALVANALAASGLAPERLELEITEGVFLAGSSTTEATFNALKSLGVRLALDDFGTGYSSLAYLKSAPFDKIKIDQSFVRGATVDGARNRAIITAIVALARALDMETTAEGVETFDQLDMVRGLEVSHVQGYIYARPMPEAEFLANATQADWGIEPSGYARQRYDRVTMYRKIGAIHDNHYYTVVLRNLSATGALIEGLLEVPVGTQFVLDFGQGQIEVATVRRSMKAQQGLQFERTLVNDGSGGLCTRSRISLYLLAEAGLPTAPGATGDASLIGQKDGRISLPLFASIFGQNPIISGALADA
ncbi:EAL domain-containing protein [Novosphingobium album (ex Liu et al. 2023)]|uniref:EAL domain-containing protein n=1 Tax=Novosphingobium album (ex Liu et al. 2023) TaxID=3031130 RepID=A0ABT5WMR9_9SPHN|nr:EAL domain-containing protein [Novosphingobium album (ex Liu et al. 2023)]MDE8651332.1 EAL domain-containing protein [Novosphingobium album (ex Liu et al. 2023)]